MAFVRKKPVVIEAMQFTEETKDQCLNWVDHAAFTWGDDGGNPELMIQTFDGVMTVSLGDWIIKGSIKGAKDEFYPCKPDIFEATYEPADWDDAIEEEN